MRSENKELRKLLDNNMSFVLVVFLPRIRGGGEGAEINNA